MLLAHRKKFLHKHLEARIYTSGQFLCKNLFSDEELTMQVQRTAPQLHPGTSK